MPKRRQRWATGSVFLVPLGTDESALGQVVGVEPEALNSVCVALMHVVVRGASGPEALAAMSADAVFCITACTRDLLDLGVWRVIGAATPVVPATPYDQTRAARFVGLKIIGSANLVELARSIHGLPAIKQYADPAYLERLLLPGWRLSESGGPRSL